MRHTRAHTANRRSHHALKGPRLSKDVNTGTVHLRHRMDENGMYRGKLILNKKPKQEKREKRIKEKREALKKA
jgi:large subunit ribosomal protein L32